VKPKGIAGSLGRYHSLCGNWPNNHGASIGDKIFPVAKPLWINHVYAIEWTADKISWFCDGIKVGEKTQWYSDASTPKPAPFDVPFYILMNLAVGGNFDGNRMPPEDFVSGDMKVDFVRSYRWSDTLTEPEIPGTTGLRTSESVSINAFQVENRIFVRSENHVRKATLYSLDGQMLLSKVSTEIIPIDGLSKGAYILQVEDVFGNQKSIKLMIK
jgi:hypothetical protein